MSEFSLEDRLMIEVATPAMAQEYLEAPRPRR
jgi:hypothetical protein